MDSGRKRKAYRRTQSESAPVTKRISESAPAASKLRRPSSSSEKLHGCSTNRSTREQKEKLSDERL